MKIKKIKDCYEIESKENLIYFSKEKNPNTKLYLYFIDVFDLTGITSVDSEACDVEVFDELDHAKNYIKDNYNITDKIINKIKWRL